jgi:hypothetical protein
MGFAGNCVCARIWPYTARSPPWCKTIAPLVTQVRITSIVALRQIGATRTDVTFGAKRREDVVLDGLEVWSER